MGGRWGASLVLCVVLTLAWSCGARTGLDHGVLDSGVVASGGGGGESGVGGASGSGAEAGDGEGGTRGPRLCSDSYERPVDVLFVIDNSGSMRDEQVSLREQMPRMMEALTSGVASDGTRFKPVADLHVGVVSTDMGLPGVPQRIDLGCGEDETNRFGDDGVLRHTAVASSGLTCAPSYPMFLRYERTADPARDAAAAAQLASDFACIATLGTAGCGFEQQLEAALKALWPSDNLLLDGQQGSFADGRPFIDGATSGKSGPTGPNAGFVRNDPLRPSLLAIVMVTDEDDCSSHYLEHFVPERVLPPDHQYKNVGLNLRCFDQSRVAGSEAARDEGRANLYSTERYAQGYRALRAGQEHLLLFAAIVGVPRELVTRDRLTRVDFSDARARDAYYDALLNDPQMQARPDPMPMTGDPNLVPSCLRTPSDSDRPTVAYPPRRIVKVAKAIGEHAVVQSICQDDFTPAIDVLLSRIGRAILRECPTE